MKILTWLWNHFCTSWVWFVVYAALIIANELTLSVTPWVAIPLAWIAASWSEKRYEKYSGKPLTQRS